MRTKAISFLVFFVVLIAVSTFSCREKIEDRNTLSSVRGADAATQSFITSVTSWAEERDLSQMSQDEFVRYIYSVNPDLDRDIIRELTMYNKIVRGERLTLRYHYFDDEGVCHMEDGDGKYTMVKFRNEIVVEVNRTGKNPIFVALSCLNGMIAIDDDPAVSGNAVMKFTIAKGQGLSRYLADDQWAINVAEEFGLALYKGRGMSSENRISPNEARNIDVSKTQITVDVKEGWTFDLSGDAWTLNGLTAGDFKGV